MMIKLDNPGKKTWDWSHQSYNRQIKVETYNLIEKLWQEQIQFQFLNVQRWEKRAPNTASATDLGTGLEM